MSVVLPREGIGATSSGARSLERVASSSKKSTNTRKMKKRKEKDNTFTRSSFECIKGCGSGAWFSCSMCNLKKEIYERETLGGKIKITDSYMEESMIASCCNQSMFLTEVYERRSTQKYLTGLSNKLGIMQRAVERQRAASAVVNIPSSSSNNNNKTDKLSLSLEASLTSRFAHRQFASTATAAAATHVHLSRILSILRDCEPRLVRRIVFMQKRNHYQEHLGSISEYTQVYIESPTKQYLAIGATATTTDTTSNSSNSHSSAYCYENDQVVFANIANDNRSKAILGRGAYGVVFAGVEKRTGRLYALKVVELMTDSQQKLHKMQDPLILRYTMKELQTLMEMYHPNVVRCYRLVLSDPPPPPPPLSTSSSSRQHHGAKRHAAEASTRSSSASTFLSDKIYMVMEMMEYGDLCRYLSYRNSRGAPFLLREIKYLIKSLLLGVQYVHEHCKMIHRDLKTANVLIDNQGMVKLSDFGMATNHIPGSRYTRNRVTLWYRAPELLLGSDIGNSTGAQNTWTHFFSGSSCVPKGARQAAREMLLKHYGDAYKQHYEKQQQKQQQNNNNKIQDAKEGDPVAYAEFMNVTCCYDTGADMWSVGVILLELLRGAFPFREMHSIGEEDGSGPDLKRAEEEVLKQIFEHIGVPDPKRWPDCEPFRYQALVDRYKPQQYQQLHPSEHLMSRYQHLIERRVEQELEAIQSGFPNAWSGPELQDPERDELSELTMVNDELYLYSDPERDFAFHEEALLRLYHKICTTSQETAVPSITELSDLLSRDARWQEACREMRKHKLQSIKERLKRQKQELNTHPSMFCNDYDATRIAATDAGDGGQTLPSLKRLELASEIYQEYKQLVSLVSDLLSYDPLQRPSAKEALQHKFFTSDRGCEPVSAKRFARILRWVVPPGERIKHSSMRMDDDDLKRSPATTTTGRITDTLPIRLTPENYYKEVHKTAAAAARAETTTSTVATVSSVHTPTSTSAVAQRVLAPLANLERLLLQPKTHDTNTSGVERGRRQAKTPPPPKASEGNAWFRNLNQFAERWIFTAAQRVGNNPEASLLVRQKLFQALEADYRASVSPATKSYLALVWRMREKNNNQQHLLQLLLGCATLCIESSSTQQQQQTYFSIEGVLYNTKAIKLVKALTQTVGFSDQQALAFLMLHALFVRAMVASTTGVHALAVLEYFCAVSRLAAYPSKLLCNTRTYHRYHEPAMYRGMFGLKRNISPQQPYFSNGIRRGYLPINHVSLGRVFMAHLQSLRTNIYMPNQRILLYKNFQISSTPDRELEPESFHCAGGDPRMDHLYKKAKKKKRPLKKKSLCPKAISDNNRGNHIGSHCSHSNRVIPSFYASFRRSDYKRELEHRSLLGEIHYIP